MKRDSTMFFNKKVNTPTNLNNKTLTVVKYRCPQNHTCPAMRVCPVGALTQTKYEAPKIDQSKCIKCGKCVKFCPMRALALE